MIREDCSKIYEAVQFVMENGLEGLKEAAVILLNEAMKIERTRALKAENYQRTEERLGYANGYKPKMVKSRLGELNLQIPQVRGDVEFYPSALEKGLRSERALKAAMAEMYINGVSTRKVTKIFEEMCGVNVTVSEVSKAMKLLDEELNKWRNRPIGEVPFMQLDARYEKIRKDGSIVSAAVLVATGIMADGRRTVLGVSVQISEAEIHWRQFLETLKQRGIHGLKMITSDNCLGLKNALKAVFGGVPWQRCQVHLQRNSFSYIPKKDMKDEVAQKISAIFNAPDKNEAQRLLDKTVEYYKEKASKLSAWMEENIPDGFAVFDLPKECRIKLRSTNMVERLNREIKRRTAVCSLFPNEESCLRLVSAVLMEQSEEWEAGNVYLKLKS